MKKLLTVLLSVLMLLSVSGCAKKADPKELLDTANSKRQSATNLTMDEIVNIDSIEIYQYSRLKKENENIYYAVSNDSVGTLNNLSVEEWLIDGIGYADSYGYKFTSENVTPELFYNVGDEVVLTSDMFETLEVKDSGSGSYTLAGALNEAGLASVIDSLCYILFLDTEESVNFDLTEVNDLEIVITKDGNLSSVFFTLLTAYADTIALEGTFEQYYFDFGSTKIGEPDYSCFVTRTLTRDDTDTIIAAGFEEYVSDDGYTYYVSEDDTTWIDVDYSYIMYFDDDAGLQYVYDWEYDMGEVIDLYSDDYLDGYAYFVDDVIVSEGLSDEACDIIQSLHDIFVAIVVAANK